MVSRNFLLLVALCLVAVDGVVRPRHPGFIIPDAAAVAAADLVAHGKPSMLLVEDSATPAAIETVVDDDNTRDEYSDEFSSIVVNQIAPLMATPEPIADEYTMFVSIFRTENATDAPPYIFDVSSVSSQPTVNFTCQNCHGLGTLGENCLRGMRGLQVARLESSGIRKFQKRAFGANAGTLIQLWLGGNQIVSFRQGKLPALVVLSLRGNKRLGSIRLNAVNLRLLDLSDTSPAAVRGLLQLKAPQLQVLQMTNSDLTSDSIVADLLQNFTSIQAIQLSDNTRLGMPRHRPFLISQSLTVLVCARCGITSIGSRALRQMPSLEVLDVRENTDLAYISMTAFRMLTGLREIRLEGCTGLLVHYPTVNTLVTNTFWPQTLKTLCVPVPIVTSGLVPERRNSERAPLPPLLAADANVTLGIQQWGIYLIADRNFMKNPTKWAVSLPEMTYTRAAQGRRVMIRALRDQVGYPCPGGFSNQWMLDRIIKAFDQYQQSTAASRNSRSNMDLLRMARSTRIPDSNGEDDAGDDDDDDDDNQTNGTDYRALYRLRANMISSEDLEDDTEKNYRTASRDAGRGSEVVGHSSSDEHADIGQDMAEAAQIYAQNQPESSEDESTDVYVDDVVIEPEYCDDACIYRLRVTLSVTIIMVSFTIVVVLWYCTAPKTEPLQQQQTPTRYTYLRGTVIDNLEPASNSVRGKV